MHSAPEASARTLRDLAPLAPERVSLAAAHDRVLAEARKVGVFGILRKPVDIEQIENRLRELIKK